MSLYQEDKITYLEEDTNIKEKYENEEKNISLEYAFKIFKAFIRSFKDQQVFIYRDQLLQNFKVGKYYLEIKIEDLNSYDEKLTTQFIEDPTYFLKTV
jgi:DNA replication licensing factor MCM5